MKHLVGPHIGFHIPVNIFTSTFLYWPIGGLLAAFAAIMIFVRLGTKKHLKYDATSPGLYGITGRFGSGKSYFLTWMASLALEKNKLVFCTYEIAGFKTFTEWETDCANGDDQWVGPVLIEESNEKGDGRGWMQIIRVPNNCLVIVDEAQGWWPSDVRKVPLDVRMWISTLRHRDIAMFWGTQYVDAVAKWLIKLSFGIWECEKSLDTHKYTLFEPRVINGKPGTRKFEARIRLKRSKKIQAMYDTKNATKVARRRRPITSRDDTATLGGLTIDPTIDPSIANETDDEIERTSDLRSPAARE